eukprot:6621230-Prymnesium_polylepis.1
MVHWPSRGTSHVSAGQSVGCLRSARLPFANPLALPIDGGGGGPRPGPLERPHAHTRPGHPWRIGEEAAQEGRCGTASVL